MVLNEKCLKSLATESSINKIYFQNFIIEKCFESDIDISLKFETIQINFAS